MPIFDLTGPPLSAFESSANDIILTVIYAVLIVRLIYHLTTKLYRS
jgi:hypothetical protein